MDQQVFTDLEPIEVRDDIEIYQGFVFKDVTRLYSNQAQEFNGTYFLAERKDGGRRIQFYAPWYKEASILVGHQLLIKGEARDSKVGKYLLVHSYTIIDMKGE